MSIVAGASNAVVDFAYSYDGVGNLTNRADVNTGVAEGFGYDSLNRLIESSLTASGDSVSKFFSYDTLGNLLLKSDVGNYAYPEPGLARPHGVLSIDGDLITAAFSYDANGNQTGATGIGRTVAYNAANRPTSITQGALTLNFADDVDHQRYKQTVVQGSSVTTTRYLDAFGVHTELVVSATTQWNDYIMVGGSMVGVRFLQGTSVTLRYFHQDHLGSIAVITDQNGALAEPRDAYDPWGKRRFANGNDDTADTIRSQTIRGFTGQEMLDSVTLVHLNGRVYDPYIGRMLSADPVVGDPLNGQSWNRYSYVWNNPLAYTDPTGYCAANCIGTLNPPAPSQNWFARHSLFGDVLRIAIAAVCVANPACAVSFGPVFAFAGSAAVAGLNGGNFVDAMHAGTLAFMQAMLMNGVGNLTQHTPAFGTVPHFENVIGHALVGCLMASTGGGTCGSGAAAGAVPAFAGPLINGESFSVRALVLNTTLGGLAAVAGGGKFANGAVTGAFGYLFNQVYIFARPTPIPFETLGEAVKPIEEAVKPAEETVEPKGGCYVLCNSEGDVVKSGRSSDLARRAGQLERNSKYEDYDFQQVYRTDDYAAQRGLVQLLYDTFKPVLDLIRPISPQNPNAARYMEAAKRYLETNQ